MEFLNLKKLLNRFMDWKIIFILHYDDDLLTDLYKRFLKFKENVLKNARTTNNSLLDTVGVTSDVIERTICPKTFWYIDQLY